VAPEHLERRNAPTSFPILKVITFDDAQPIFLAPRKEEVGGPLS